SVDHASAVFRHFSPSPAGTDTLGAAHSYCSDRARELEFRPIYGLPGGLWGQVVRLALDLAPVRFRSLGWPHSRLVLQRAQASWRHSDLARPNVGVVRGL